MKILELFSQGELKTFGVWQECLDSNEHYSVYIIYLAAGVKTGVYGNPNIVQTTYVLKGILEASIYIDKLSELGKKVYTENQGWSLLPGQTQQLNAKTDCVAFVVYGKVVPEKLRDISKKNHIMIDKINELNDYLVTKPWGSEQWLVENMVYVLKGITMNAGMECSLQVHEQKVEMNLILWGSAKVSLGYDEQIKQKIISHCELGKEQSAFSVKKEIISQIKQNMQSRLIGQYEGWKVKPFQIHQVLSTEAYFALEVSTPEVDDIVRLKDLYGRPSGRIISEHQQNK